MKFKASLGITPKIITGILIVLMSVILAQALRDFNDAIGRSVIFLFLFVAGILCGWGYSVNAYELRNGNLFINRPFGKKLIEIDEIKSAERVAAKDLAMSFRFFGNGGLMGYYGYFYNANYGRMKWYATNLKNAVLLRLTNGKKIVITPDEPEHFLNELHNRKR